MVYRLFSFLLTARFIMIYDDLRPRPNSPSPALLLLNISESCFHVFTADTEGMARKLRETEDLLQAAETEKQSAESQVIHVITLCW